MDDAKVYQELRFELTRLATALVGPSEAEDVVAAVGNDLRRDAAVFLKHFSVL